MVTVVVVLVNVAVVVTVALAVRTAVAVVVAVVVVVLVVVRVRMAVVVVVVPTAPATPSICLSKTSTAPELALGVDSSCKVVDSGVSGSGTAASVQVLFCVISSNVAFTNGGGSQMCRNVTRSSGLYKSASTFT